MTRRTFGWGLALACQAALASQTALEFGGAPSATPRSAALGGTVWTDSTLGTLFSLTGNPAGLVGTEVIPLEFGLSSRGLGWSGGGNERSDASPWGLSLRSGRAGRYGFRGDLAGRSQTLREGEDGVKYEADRLRWGLDVGTALNADGNLAIGLGVRFRFPSEQTQDQPSSLDGDYVRWQGGLEALRLGLSGVFAGAYQVGFRLDSRLDVDTLRMTPSAGSTKLLHRYARVVFPMLGFSGGLVDPKWPLRLMVDYATGTANQIGVLKTTGGSSGYNLDFPQQTVDTSRALVLAQMRLDQLLPDQVFRPVLGYHREASSTQLYTPTEGTNSPWSKEGILNDSTWDITRSGLITGVAWSWMDWLSGLLEYQVDFQELDFSDELDPTGTLDQSHTDHRVSLGMELSHTLVPALRGKVPAGDRYSLRLGWRRQSFAGSGVEAGFLEGMTPGYEPAGSTYSGSWGEAGWGDNEYAVGLRPSLGEGADESAFTCGLGASWHNGALGLEAALLLGSVETDAGVKSSETGWNVAFRWAR